MDGQRELTWVLITLGLAVCTALPAKREVIYYNPGIPQQQYNPALYSPQAYQPQQYQGYQPQQVRSVGSEYYQQQLQHQHQLQQQQQQQLQQLPYQPQYQRVLLYNPNTGNVYQQQAAYPLAPAGAFLPLPLREEGGATGTTGTTGGSTSGWGFNPSEYLTVLQNYWQTLTSPNSPQSGKPPTEAANPSPSAPSGAESPAESPAPSAVSEGAKKPENPEMPAVMPEARPEMPAMPEAPSGPASTQRFIVVSQPNMVANPAALPSASNGAVSTYLLLRNQPVYGFQGQSNALRAQPQQPQQPFQQPLQQPFQQQPQQQTVLPSVSGPMVLVRTADNKYGLAPASNPQRLLVSGEGIRAQDDVQASGPGSHALAFQRFLLARQGQLSRQGQFAPGFYPAPHPGVVHSLTDESISIDALRDSSNATEPSSPAPAPTTPASTNKDEEEVVDSDAEKPVSIAQILGDKRATNSHTSTM